MPELKLTTRRSHLAEAYQVNGIGTHQAQAEFVASIANSLADIADSLGAITKLLQHQMHADNRGTIASSLEIAADKLDDLSIVQDRQTRLIEEIFCQRDKENHQ